MFKKLTFIMCCIAQLLQVSNVMADSQQTKSTFKWLTNYEDAVKQAKSVSKPLLLLFTGSDWCTWCTKLEEETFGTNDFAAVAGNKYVFVKLDFPLYSPQDAEIKIQNKHLQQKFDVRSFPTVIIYDPQNNQTIGTVGYRPGGGKQYGEYLNKLLSDYSSYKQNMSSVDKASLSGSDLKALYEQANKLALKNDAKRIVNVGIDSDQSLFFLTEKYRQYIENGQMNTSDAIVLRQQLLSADPHNERKIPYQIALIEFDSLTNHIDPATCNPDAAILPLNAYIEKFGAKDRENTWRLQMIMTQVYLDSCNLSSALKHAQLAYESAPSSAQQEIAKAVQTMTAQVTTQSLLTRNNH